MTSDRVATGETPCYSYVMIPVQGSCAGVSSSGGGHGRSHDARAEADIAHAAAPDRGKGEGRCLPTNERKKEIPIPSSDGSAVTYSIIEPVENTPACAFGIRRLRLGPS